MRTGKFMAGAAAALLATLMTASPALARETSIPEKPALYMRDDAGALSGSQEDSLNSMLEEYDRKTGNQIAVLLVRTTGDETIEKYSYRVASRWGMGQKGKDNGILVTIATDDHKDRIEVGKGLEEYVTDSRAGRMLRSREVTKAFRNGRWYDGTRSIVSQLQECIRTKGKSADRRARRDAIVERGAFLLVIGGVWISVIQSLKSIARKKGRGGIIPAAGYAGGAGVIGTILMGPESALVPVFIATFIVTIIVSIAAGKTGADGPCISHSSGGGSSFGGGSSSSGGSSFGGGSFGGGGASGGW